MSTTLVATTLEEATMKYVNPDYIAPAPGIDHVRITHDVYGSWHTAVWLGTDGWSYHAQLVVNDDEQVVLRVSVAESRDTVVDDEKVIDLPAVTDLLRVIADGHGEPYIEKA